MNASEVQLWKPVPGILTADPRAVPAARTLPEVGHDEALELALHGASILHPDAVLAAKRTVCSMPLKLPRWP